ncbi:MAG: DMT family transporter [Gemmatimonadaceae bacterium]
MTHAMLVAMSLIWGVNFSVMKLATGAMNPLAFNASRVALAAAALLVAARLTRAPRPSARHVVMLLALGVLGCGFYQLFFIEGLSRTRAGNAALVQAGGPAYIALIGWAMGIERIAWRGWAGIALSLAGMSLVVFGKTGTHASASTLSGNLLVALASLCWAVFAVLMKRYAAGINPVQVAALTMLGGSIPLLLHAAPAMAGTNWASVSTFGWLAIVYSGLGSLVVAYLFWYRGVRVLGPTRTAMYSNLQPVIALLIAWPTLREVPTPWQLAGTATIVAGVLLTQQ